MTFSEQLQAAVSDWVTSGGEEAKEPEVEPRFLVDGSDQPRHNRAVI